jgi:hypothetical protein
VSLLRGVRVRIPPPAQRAEQYAVSGYWEEKMKRSGSTEGGSTSELIDKRIAELGDWRGATLSRMRKLIKQADPEVVEEWKWRKASHPGVPVWSHQI